MRFLPALVLILPSSIASATADKWPNATYGESPSQHVDSLFQRDAVAEPSLPQKPARGLKKMSDDEGEKFYFHYWQFDDGLPVTAMSNYTGSDDAYPLDGDRGDKIQNRSYPLRPALAPEERQASSRRAVTPRYIPRLFRRDFKCPVGTAACSGIDRPKRCCGEDDTCTLIQDTGSGDVGCCPKGQTCSDTIGSCPGEYSTCSESLGGGCCIPGYECVQGGCKFRHCGSSARRIG